MRKKELKDLKDLSEEERIGNLNMSIMSSILKINNSGASLKSIMEIKTLTTLLQSNV